MTEKLKAEARVEVGGLRFGVAITNIAAADVNPIKHGWYLRRIYRSGRMNAGAYIEYLTDDGRVHLTPPDNIALRSAPALSASVEHAEPVAGFVLVPKEPTEVMEEAGRKATGNFLSEPGAKRVYLAMLAAAPTPPPSTAPELEKRVAELEEALRQAAYRMSVIHGTVSLNSGQAELILGWVKDARAALGVQP